MGALFGGPPKPPKPPPVLEIPDFADPGRLAAKRREELAAMSRSGRASTMLTGEGDYAGSKLGTP